MTATGLAFVLVTVFVALYALRRGEGVGVDPEWVYLLFFAAPLLPIAVWKGEYNFRHSYLASLPVHRSHHVLAKIAAGWVWLMVVVGAFLLWVLIPAILTGGPIGVDEMRVRARDLPPGTPAEEAAAFARRWKTPLWQWAVFFTGPTITYLFGSAVVLAGPPTRRWLAGLTVALLFLLFVMNEKILPGELEEWIGWTFRMILLGRYGLMTLLAATDAFGLQTASGEEIPVYKDLPAPEVWLGTTLLWMGLALTSLLLVIWRSRRS